MGLLESSFVNRVDPRSSWPLKLVSPRPRPRQYYVTPRVSKQTKDMCYNNKSFTFSVAILMNFPVPISAIEFLHSPWLHLMAVGSPIQFSARGSVLLFPPRRFLAMLLPAAS
jgi:hypothetical protein